MKLIKSIKCRIQVNEEEKNILQETLNVWTYACNDILAIAKEKKDFNQYHIHHLVYHPIKDKYSLQSNLVVRAIARVCHKRKKQPKAFKCRSMDVDTRTFRFIERTGILSLSTIQGRKKQRYPHNSWDFARLQQFITYKALEKGISTIFVDPKNTSHISPSCGLTGSRIKHIFFCSCGYRNNADFVGAYNISKRGFALLDGLSCKPALNQHAFCS